MSFIIVNGTESSRGEVEFFQSIESDENGDKVVYDGVYITDSYFEQIDKIQTHRFILDDVYVYREKFSSEKDEIAYYFTCKKFERVVYTGE